MTSIAPLIHSEYMNKFFKLTKTKILLIIFFIVCACLATYLVTVYTASLPDSFCLPDLENVNNVVNDTATMNTNPSSISDLANSVLNKDFPNDCGNIYPGIDSPLVTTIVFIQTIIVYILFPYFLSCLAVAIANNLKKKKKNSKKSIKK